MPHDELIDAIIAAVEEMILAGEEIPDEIMSEIADIISNHLLVENPPVGAPQGPPEPPSAPYPSSNIYGFHRDPESGDMLVKFMGKDTAESGPIYKYTGVPENIFEIIKRGAVAPKTSGSNKYHAWYKGVTPSHGASVNALLKQGGYPYQMVVGPNQGAPAAQRVA